MPKPDPKRRTFQHLVTTTLATATCPHCRASIWTGHCAGEPTRIDPTPINTHAELGATLAGQTTYSVDPLRRPTLRTRWNIHRWPAPEHARIHAQHQCGRTWPHTCRDNTPSPWAGRTNDGSPPF